MEVRIDTYVENKEGNRYPINRAYFVMVALDENEQPKKVPRLNIETVEQQAEWDAAIKRHTLRKQRKAEGY
jgi:acyl-CoA hydrolase